MPFGLKEITDGIFDDMDRMVLRIGERLQTAFDEYPGLYETWVVEYLPFGLDAARRMRMVFKASRSLPESVLERLPRPWQAAYALTRLPAEVLCEAVVRGEVNPGLTVRESVLLVARLNGRETLRFSEPDIIAGRLMGHQPESLSADVRLMLHEWLAALSNEPAGPLTII